MNFIGPGTRLADTDLPRIGSQIGVGEDEIHAFLDVETSGSGFDAQKRPKALYEPHVAFRHLSGDNLAQAVKQGLAYRSWGEKPYPHDSYPRILSMMAIDETAALKATSWGLGQVLGENYVDAGYDSPQEMVAAFVESEANQLQGAVNFIKANHLDDELRDHRWASFARGYNGAGYRKNAYDTKLAARYAFWSKIKDTPWTRT